MTSRSFLPAALLVASVAFGVAAQQPPAAPATPPSQQSDVSIRISGSDPSLPPKIAVPSFIALTNDAETQAAAKTIGEVLWDDLEFEKEFYMIPRDTYRSIPQPATLDQVPLDRWKELNADGVLVGTVAKTGTGVLVQVRLIKVATGETAFGKQYSGAIANPRRYAHTIWDEMYKDQMQGHGVARTRLTFSSDRDAERIQGPSGNRDGQEIYIADYDGANPTKVTNTRTLNITPTWAPDNQA